MANFKNRTFLEVFVRTYRRLVESYQRGSFPLNPAVLITAVFLVLMVGLMFLQSTGHPRVEQQIEVIQVTQQVSQDYGQPWMVSTDDVTIYVPANSLETDGTISIARVEQNQFQVSADTWNRLKTVLIEFLDPEGEAVPDFSFLNRVEVCFRLTEEQWQDFEARPAAYQVQHYRADANPPVWEVLPMSTYEENFELCGQTFRLSVFSLAVQPGDDSQIPVTGPTVISVVIPTSSIPREQFEPYPTKERERPSATPRQPTSTAIQPSATNAQPTQIQPTRTPARSTDTPVPPTSTPRPTNTRRPPTRTPTQIILPTISVPTLPPPTTPVPPTDPPPTDPPPTDPPPTDPPPTDPPPTDPPPTDPPPTEPDPTDPPTEEPTPSGIIGLLELILLISLPFLR